MLVRKPLKMHAAEWFGDDKMIQMIEKHLVLQRRPGRESESIMVWRATDACTCESRTQPIT